MRQFLRITAVKLVNGRYFAIERFDIVAGRRVHTLTAAALLQQDFQRHTADYVNLLSLTGFLTQNPCQVEQMFRRMVFNVIADNKDDHAKNFSFLCDGCKWSLAPAYDLTYSPEGTRGQHATSVKYAGNPCLEDIVAAGEGIRIPKSRCLDIIEEIYEICAKELAEYKIVKL